VRQHPWRGRPCGETISDRTQECDEGDIPLGNPFAIEMRKQVDQVEVLQEKRARCAYSLRGIGVEDGSAIGGRVGRRISELGVAHDCAKMKRLEA
jgi:hypothetical protein